MTENANFISCNFNQQKAEDSWSYPLLFIVFCLLTEIISNLFILPHFNSIYKFEFNLCLTVAVILFYLRLYFSDPGFKKNKINKSLNKLLSDGEVMNNICPWCVNYINNTTKHCYYCKRCIENLDHHCIWIKNCIGKSNFCEFVIFLILINIKVLINLVFAITSI